MRTQKDHINRMLYQDHQQLGCTTCRFADRNMVGVGPCCTYPGKPPRYDDMNRCLKYKPREED